MTERYQIVDTDANGRPRDTQELARFLAKEGQLLLPMLDLIEQGEQAIDDLIDVMGRATIEAVLQMSAAQIAGPKQQGNAPCAAPVCNQLFVVSAQLGKDDWFNSQDGDSQRAEKST